MRCRAQALSLILFVTLSVKCALAQSTPSISALTLTGSLNTGRMVHTATLLDNGNVLIAGGVDGFGYNTISSAESVVRFPGFAGRAGDV